MEAKEGLGASTIRLDLFHKMLQKSYKSLQLIFRVEILPHDIEYKVTVYQNHLPPTQPRPALGWLQESLLCNPWRKPFADSGIREAFYVKLSLLRVKPGHSMLVAECEECAKKQPHPTNG